MGTDSLMELLRSDINGLSNNNPVIVERIQVDVAGWYDWACETLAKHAPEIEVQVMSRIIAQVNLNEDLAAWRTLTQDPIYTAQGFTAVGGKLLDAYIMVTRETIDAYTQRHLQVQRQRHARIVLGPVQQQLLGCVLSVTSLLA